MEAAMNQLWLERGARLKVVRWPFVNSPLKGRKRGMLRGVIADIGMLRDIVATIGPWRIFAQIRGLRGTRTRDAHGPNNVD